MKNQNVEIEGHIDQGIKNHFTDTLMIKRDLIKGNSTPVISWCLAPTPMVNIQIILSKYKNHLDIKKFLCEESNVNVHTIYSGPIPKMKFEDDEHFDSAFVFKLIKHYQYIAL